jgi:hypothetical protein
MSQAGREAMTALRPEQVAADFDALLQQLADNRAQAASFETGPQANREIA